VSPATWAAGFAALAERSAVREPAPEGGRPSLDIVQGRIVGRVKKSKVSEIRVSFVLVNGRDYISIRGFDKPPEGAGGDLIPRAGISIRLDLATAVADLLDRAIVEAEADGRLQLPDNSDEP
jgi:hypothetical protein